MKTKEATGTVKHPAKYSAALLPVFARHLVGFSRILDPMADVGTVHRLREMLACSTVGVEIEPEWAALHPDTRVGSVLKLPFFTASFDAILVSPPYGNRMADHHNARDGSPRHTYRHYLGRPLADDNAGALQWGDDYRTFHRAAWAECVRVLRPGGRFVLNCKDHIRAGRLQRVTDWHVGALLDAGLSLVACERVVCPGQRHGQNGAARVDFESVIVFEVAA